MNVKTVNLISMVYEVDLYKNWFPFFKQADTLANPTKHSKVNYLRVSPPVLSDRELYLYGFGIDR